jgi:hypothetical protein
MRWWWVIVFASSACVHRGVAECRAACGQYRALGCAEGVPTQAGDPCEAWCTEAERAGIDLAGAPACARAAGTCEAVSACADE